MLESEARATCEIEPLDSILQREVFAHKQTVSSLFGDKTVGVVSCSKLDYEVKVFKPSTLDLWVVLNQYHTVIDPLSTHPNPYVKQHVQSQVDRIQDTLTVNNMAKKNIVVRDDSLKKKESIFLTQPNAKIYTTIAKFTNMMFKDKVKNEIEDYEVARRKVRRDALQEITITKLDKFLNDHDVTL
jgi:hypothetical protein